MTQPDDYPYTFAWLPVESLFIDTRYQRPETRLIREIAERFNWEQFGTLIVSKRAQLKYATIDGQQRRGAALMVGKVYVPCLLGIGLTVAQEARLFSRLQEDRLSVRPVHRFRADVCGEIPRALEIMAALDRLAIELVESSGRNAPPDALSAVVALEKMYDRYGLPIVQTALEVIIAAWPQQRGRFRGEVMQSIGGFLAIDEPKIDVLINMLSAPKIGSPDKLMERSANARKAGAGLGGGSIGYTIEVLRNDYRRRTRSARRTAEYDN